MLSGSLRIPVGDGSGCLAGVETLAVGSAKVPHLPMLPDVLAARDAGEAVAALADAGDHIGGYARRLDALGYTSMARTVVRGLARAQKAAGMAAARRAGESRPAPPPRLNSDLLSLLEWVYGASLKTAGDSTMSFVPWVADEAACAPAELRGPGQRPAHVRLAASSLETIAQVNTDLYVGILGALGDAVRAAGRLATGDELVAAALAPAGAGAAAGPVATVHFADPADVKCMAKIDYKFGAAGRPVVVDLNAGLIGAGFDDDLLAALGETAAGPQSSIARRLAESIVALAARRLGHPPRRMALAVLDEQMYETWAASDLARLLDELGGVAPAGAAPPIAVITLAALLEYTGHLGDPGWTPSVVGDAPWPGKPDVVVAYTGRIGQEADPAALARLADAGVALIDERHHSLLAVKAMADTRLLPDGQGRAAALPEVVVLGRARECARGCAGPIDDAWSWAGGRHEAIAIKLEKARRKAASGDHTTAFIYPVTAVGRAVAERQMARVTARLTEDGWGEMQLTASPVDLGGGLTGDDGLRRDVEARTYVFPQLAGG